MKRIIICCDGTWNKPDQSQEKATHKDTIECLKESWTRQPSNVVKITRAILPKTSDGIHQVVFYDEGIGTNAGIINHYIGGALGVGLTKNLLDCYRFIARNYSDGDEIYLFGFSRGAFTVRSLAGLIHRCGILPKEQIYWTKEAYEIYRLRYYESEDDVDSFFYHLLPSKIRRWLFKNKYKKLTVRNKKCVEDFNNMNKVKKVKIKFIGVWDTVGSLGIPGWRGLSKKYRFHDVKLGDHILNAYQALAIDERRRPFKPSIWEEKSYDEQKLEQMWFAGVHTNIGGGYKPDGLANYALHWMVEAAKLNGKGLEFNDNFIDDNYGFPKPKNESESETKYITVPENSMTWYYYLLIPHRRPIGKQIKDDKQNNSQEFVHPSVFKYQKHLSNKGISYEPPNLMEYLNRNK